MTEPKQSEKTLGEQQVRDWAKRHDIQATYADLKAMFDDARTIDQLDAQRSQGGEWRVEKEDGFVWIRSVSEAITNAVAYTLAMPTLLQSVCDAHNATLRPAPRKEAK